VLLFGILIFGFLFLGFSVIIILIYNLTSNKVAKKVLVGLWFLPVIAVMTMFVIGQLNEKKVLKKVDYYGTYVIDRRFFKGKEADWQYNTFRFEITENDSIFFHVTDKERIISTYRGRIDVTKPYSSARLLIDMPQPTHHVIASNPTIYRSAWNFYLVFHSQYYNNMYFRKGRWKPFN
jgi:hypothetical protein